MFSQARAASKLVAKEVVIEAERLEVRDKVSLETRHIMNASCCVQGARVLVEALLDSDEDVLVRIKPHTTVFQRVCEFQSNMASHGSHINSSSPTTPRHKSIFWEL